tara:strand:- start:3437 stop:5923 length:2487 start_codon:yes stop_codon:yes gene_type:complete
MLDQETKKKINNLRDTLVGKVPDPKSQVEQIMIALIYKFMNDMDKESTDLGGEASFFVGDFEKYSWDNLFGTKVSGSELVDLYSTAVESMEENPNIPQLFRDIFKNAYIPYKDAETLRLFLSQIDDFEYSKDSEQLGDAFEHILNSLSSQGDAGQFRTPRHIIDFIVEIVDPNKDETVLDPASGTSGFLISAFKHIVQSNSEKSSGDLLSAAERKKIMENINGYDISPDMVRIGLANMYLHGFPEPNVVEYDALTSEDRWNEYFDVILANPPFMTPKGGIRPHNKFGLKSNKAEVLFVDYILTHLKPNGRAGIIVPEGIIFQSGKAYKELRKKLIENGLTGVVSLPAGVFNPYSGVKTSILILDKSKNPESVYFAQIKQDGFSLSAQRNPISQNDLPQVFKEIKSNSSGDFMKLVSKEEIIENKYSLQFSTYINEEIESSNYEVIKLSEVVSLIRGVNFSKKDQLEELTEEAIRVATTKAAQEHQVVEKDLYYIPKKLIKNEDKYLKDGDILISVSNSLHLVGRTTFIKDLKYDLSFGAFMSCIRVDPEVILPEYLYRILNSENTKKFFRENARTTTNISNLPNEVIINLQIPLPPLEKQQEIAGEIEQYQKVIDGARQVVENTKFAIDFNTIQKFETLALSEIAEVKGGKRVPKGDSLANSKTPYPYIRVSDMKENYFDSSDIKYIEKDVYEKIKNYTISSDDIYISVAGTIGKVGIVSKEFSGANLTENANKLVIKDNNYSQKYLTYTLRSDFVQKQLILATMSVAQPKLSIERLKKIEIPIINKIMQEELVNEIETQINLIEELNKIISLNNNKIDNLINSLYTS